MFYIKLYFMQYLSIFLLRPQRYAVELPLLICYILNQIFLFLYHCGRQKSIVFQSFPLYLVSLSTCRKMSKNMCACCSWKISAGRMRMLLSPQPPAWTPLARRRDTRSSRTLGLGALTARNVPRPRVADRMLGNSCSRPRRPLYRASPAARTTLSSSSLRITLSTSCRSSTFPGSPIHVLKTRYGRLGVRSALWK